MNSATDKMPDGPALRLNFAERALRFLQSPFYRKTNSIAFRLRRWFPRAPIPLRLSCGAWWILRNDILDQPLIHNNFETLERAFVEGFLQHGMTIIDIGAHHGLYTLIAAKRVGPQGHVYAFEPSPRERRVLTQHIRLNRIRNVSVLNLALGNADIDAVLYLAEGEETGCNSLRPPAVAAGTSSVRVHVTRLDDWLRIERIALIDFIKMDVEGGEMDLLNGAELCLKRKPRPVILVEVEDIRTRAWGYPAREIIQHLAGKGYRWYWFKEMGSLAELDLTSVAFDGNFVACPEEKTDLLSKLSGWHVSK